MFFIVAFLLFSCAFFGTGYYVWVIPQQEAARALDTRLRGVRSTVRASAARGGSDLVKTEKRGRFGFLGGVGLWSALVGRLQVTIQQADLKWRATDILMICLGLGVVSYLFFWLVIGIPALRILFALMVAWLPVMYILRARNKRMKKFEEQLPDAIDLFTRTMRAGHNIHSGLETIAEETSDPIRMEFRKVIEELALGSAIEPALHKMGERAPILDLKFFITGLILQRQTGANMVSVLENLSTLVRERLNMAAKLKAHTAQQRFSAGLLCSLPFVVGLGFWFLKPEYMRLLWTDPLGIKFFTYAIISEITGILIIRQMANVKA